MQQLKQSRKVQHTSRCTAAAPVQLRNVRCPLYHSQSRRQCAAVRGEFAGSSDAAAAAAAATNNNAASPPPPPPPPPPRRTAIDWDAKRRKMALEDIAAAARRAGIKPPAADSDGGAGASLEDALARGVEALEALIPGFQVDLERMKAADWARAALDPNAAAVRLVALKGAYPGADLARVLQEKPALLLKPPERIAEEARQVHKLLDGAKDRDALITALPMLTDPRTTIAVLVTVEKWYFKKKDPIAVLEADPDLIRRAEACDVPLEPVYVDPATGEYMAPSLNYKEKRADWQAYIDRTVYKQKD